MHSARNLPLPALSQPLFSFNRIEGRPIGRTDRLTVRVVDGPNALVELIVLSLYKVATQSVQGD